MATRILARSTANPAQLQSITVERYGTRYWGVYDQVGALVCVTLYLKGAEEVVRRLSAAATRRKGAK